MITNDKEYSVSIKSEGYFATKFADPLTEYMDHIIGMRMLGDTWTGESDAPMGYVTLLGKRIMFADDRGFVCHDKYKNEHDARLVYDAIDAYYCEWANDDHMDDGDYLDCDRDSCDCEDAHAAAVQSRSDYCAYVIDSVTHDVAPVPFDEWVTLF